MRRARIKALAAVPVRKKTIQDTVILPDENNVPDKEQKKEDISNTDKQEQEAIKDAIKIKKEEDKFSIDKQDGEGSIKNVENVEKKNMEESKANLVQPEAMSERINSQKLCSPIKSNTFQEPYIQINNKSEKITNNLAQKIVPPPDVPTGIDTGKVYLYKIIIKK